MTTQKHDQSEEQAFEDFLQGRGELVKQLKALSQLTPSAALDAAILASAKAAVAQAERSKQSAANDPVSPQNSPHKPGFLSRYRMPLAMAASVMVAVLLAVQWHAQPDYPVPVLVAQAPSAEPATSAAIADSQLARADIKAKDVAESVSNNTAASPSVAAAKPANSMDDAKAEKKAATQSKNQTEKQAGANALAINESLKPSADRPNAAPSQLAQADTAAASQMRFKSSATQDERAAPAAASAFAPAQAPAPSVANLSKESTKVVAAPAPEAGASASDANVKADGQEKQKAWIARIETMINAGSRNEALAEWEKFEKSYPNYAAYSVPEKFKAQIKALKN